MLALNAASAYRLERIVLAAVMSGVEHEQVFVAHRVE
jgi:hypothetical protein